MVFFVCKMCGNPAVYHRSLFELRDIGVYSCLLCKAKAWVKVIRSRYMVCRVYVKTPFT